MRRLAISLLLGAVAGCTTTTTIDSTVAESTTTPAPPTITTSIAPTTTTTVPSTTTTEVTVDLDWFRIELIVLESHCFDTAGANVTVEPDLWITDDSGNLIVWTYGPATVVYEIHGGEAVDTLRLELTGPTPEHEHYAWTAEEHTISTASCEYQLTAEVVRVIER